MGKQAYVSNNGCYALHCILSEYYKYCLKTKKH